MIIVFLVLVVLCDSIGVGAFVDGCGDCSATGRVFGGFFICNVSIDGSSSLIRVASLASFAQIIPSSEGIFDVCFSGIVV